MTRALRFTTGEYYHIYNRGTEKRKIFESRGDYSRFSVLLYACNTLKPTNLREQGNRITDVIERERGETIVSVGAYCLMPNHFHLLVKEKVENGISRFMQKIQTAYTMYFNEKNQRTGALMQGKFKAVQAIDDRYLKYLISYIHLNPIKLIDSTWKETGIRNKVKAKNFLLDRYQYSSFIDYIGKQRPEASILEPKVLTDLVDHKEEITENLFDWFNYCP